MLLESQIHGGVLMGVSYALYEERLLDRATGRMVNANLEQYKVAGPREVPQIDVTVIENYQGRSATDAYGIASPPTSRLRRQSETLFTMQLACDCGPCR